MNIVLTEKRIVAAGIWIAAAFAIWVLWFNTIAAPQQLQWSDWAFHDWLVNYQAGFVRRGLIGEFVFRLFNGREILTLNYLIFALGSIYVCLSALQLATTPRLGKESLLYVFAPTGFFAAVISNQYYFHKEVLFYIAILSVGMLYRRWRRTQAEPLRFTIIAIIIATTLTLPFVHEAFIFFCALFYWLVLRHVTRRSLASGLFLVSTLILFGLLSVFHGTFDQTEVIWNSLSPDAQAVSPHSLQGGAISALYMTLAQGLRYSANVLLSGLGTYYTFTLLLVYLIVGCIHARSKRLPLLQTYSSPTFFINFLLVCASFAPLFVVAWDWGRWVVGIFLVFSSIALCDLLIELDDERLRANLMFRPQIAASSFFFVLLIFSIFTRTPECCFRAPFGSLRDNKMVDAALQRLAKAREDRAESAASEPRRDR